MFFILLTVVVLFLVAFGNTTVNYIKTNFENLSMAISIFINWRFIWEYIILFFIFWLMYKYVPNHKVQFKTQIPGALFAALGWFLLSYIFSIYLRIFINFSAVYGNLTSLILLMLWVYWCMFIILVGAEINSWIDKNAKKKLS